MSPFTNSGSDSGIASFSFFSPASSPVIHHSSAGQLKTEPGSADAPLPPSGPALTCVTTKTAPGKSPQPKPFSTLPTTLIYWIKTWLSAKDTLQLLLCNRQLQNEVQGLYKVRLRPGEAEKSASPIASYQNYVNRLPAFVPMDTAGELMFQKCVALRATDVSEAQYCSRIIDILRSRVAKSQDLAELLDIFIGAGLGLGAQSMTARHLDRLLAAILDTCKTSSDDQMLAMIYGSCLALGPADSTTRRKNIETVFRHIRDSYLTSTKQQLRAMIQGLCMSCIVHGIPALCSNFVVPNILSSCKTLHPTQIQEMIYGVGLAHGAAEMKPEKCAELTQTILDQYEMELEMSLHVMESFWVGRLNVQKIPLAAVLHGWLVGLGGQNMSPANLEVVLVRILGRAATWNKHDMATGIGTLCMELGGKKISPAKRDTVLAWVLASYTSCSAEQIGAMIWGVCRALGGAPVSAAPAPVSSHNLEAVLSQVLQAVGICSQQQFGAMMINIFIALGERNLTAAHRHVLTTRISQSEHAHAVIEAINLVPGWRSMITFLQLQTAPEDAERE